MRIKQRIERIEDKIMGAEGIVVAFSDQEAAEKVREYRRVHLREPSSIVIFEDPFSGCRKRDGVEGA